MLSITLPAGAAPGTIVQAPDGSGGTVQVQLPHGLRHHELPHWPTEMSIAEIELTRTPFGKGGVERGEARA